MARTLHNQLLAAISAREERARAATAGPGWYKPGKVWRGEEFVGAGPVDAAVCVAATGPADEPQSMADAAFIAAEASAVLRQTTRDRRVLERHRQMVPLIGTAQCRWCVAAGYVDGEWTDMRPRAFPCEDLRDLVEAYGIDLSPADPLTALDHIDRHLAQLQRNLADPDVIAACNRCGHRRAIHIYQGKQARCQACFACDGFDPADSTADGAR